MQHCWERAGLQYWVVSTTGGNTSWLVWGVGGPAPCCALKRKHCLGGGRLQFWVVSTRGQHFPGGHSTRFCPPSSTTLGVRSCSFGLCSPRDSTVYRLRTRYHVVSPGGRTDQNLGAALPGCVRKEVAVRGGWGRSTGSFPHGDRTTGERAALQVGVNKSVELLGGRGVGGHLTVLFLLGAELFGGRGGTHYQVFYTGRQDC